MILTLLILQPFDSVWSVAVLLACYGFDWACLLTKLIVSRSYVPFRRRDPGAPLPSVSIIVPVADEAPDIFRRVLSALTRAADGLDAEVFVVGNGRCSRENVAMAAAQGFRTLTLETANKRKAITAAAALATKEIAVLVDSDTIAADDTLKLILENFDDPAVGGVAPRSAVFDSRGSVFRLYAHWHEDIRFNDAFRGMSARNSIHCLPGRLVAVRLALLQRYAHAFVNQRLLGTAVITGDDRVLTAYLLRDGYRAIYDGRATVQTDAPTTLAQFARQRLRWARTSFRENLLAASWMRSRPYIAFILISDLVTRWISFAALALVVSSLAVGGFAADAVPWSTAEVALALGSGFLLDSYLRHIPRLLRYPGDFWFAPIFALISMFVLRPIEWFGTFTFARERWAMRNAAAVERATPGPLATFPRKRRLDDQAALTRRV